MEEEPNNLQEWELLSDSDINSSIIGFDEIIHSDYFSVDSDKNESLSPPINDSLEEILRNFQPESEKSCSFPEDDSQMEMGFDGIEPRVRNSDAVDPKLELDIGEINKAGPFLVDGDSKMKVGIEAIAKGDSFDVDNSEMDLGFEGTEPYEATSRHDDFIREEIQNGDSFLMEDSKMEVGILETESIDQNSDGAADLKESIRDNSGENAQELGSDSCVELSNSKSISDGDGQKKVLIWWKLPLDILKLCVSRMRPVWSIPIMAAVIGILTVGRRMYRMKRKSRRIPLKLSFDEKKATSKLLVHASHFNEVVVRRVPIIRSPLLTVTSGGVTPRPTIGLL